MTSELKTQTNRQNALKSTGPNSENGQKRSSMNALKHGLSAQTIVIKGESATDFDALHVRFIEAFEPVGAMEEELVSKLAIASWRLRRIPRIEAGFFRLGQDSAKGSLYVANLGVIFMNMRDSNGQYEGYHAFGQFLRYEAAAERSFYQALHALERLQAKRRGEHVSAPHVANVSVDVTDSQISDLKN